MLEKACVEVLNETQTPQTGRPKGPKRLATADSQTDASNIPT